MTGLTTYVEKQSPKASEIVQDIRRQIFSGYLTPGARLPSVSQMQKQYDACHLTVRRAISHLRETGFVFSKERSGTFVNSNPPCLCNIGLVRPYYEHPSQFVTALEREAKHISRSPAPDGLSRRFNLYKEIRCPNEDIRRHHRELFDAIVEHSVGGLILFGPSDALTRVIAKEYPDMPCVGFHSIHVPGTTALQSATISEPALDLLATQGRRRPAFITVAPNREPYTSQFIAAANARGMVSHPHWVISFYPGRVDWAQNFTMLLLKDAHDRPDAIIIDDDNLVPAVTAGIASTGVRVPEELTVVAHTNFPWPTQAEVPVIRMGTDTRELMQTAVEIPGCFGRLELYEAQGLLAGATSRTRSNRNRRDCVGARHRPCPINDGRGQSPPLHLNGLRRPVGAKNGQNGNILLNFKPIAPAFRRLTQRVRRV